MSKFFAEGNISDEENNSDNEENDNLDTNQPSYQYVALLLFRTSSTKGNEMSNEL